MLDAAGVDSAFLQYIFMFGGEVLTNYPDYAHIGEVAGGEEK